MEGYGNSINNYEIDFGERKMFSNEQIIIDLPLPTAEIHIGSWHIQIYDKTFTEEQIKNMREFFGWEVENLCVSQSEIQITTTQKKKLIVLTQM